MHPLRVGGGGGRGPWAVDGGRRVVDGGGLRGWVDVAYVAHSSPLSVANTNPSL